MKKGKTINKNKGIYSRMKYLCSPYSHADPKVRHERYLAVLKKTGEYLANGEFVFSPICYSHQFAVSSDFDVRWEFWKPFDLHMIEISDGLIVMQLEGWEQSIGVKAEIEYAKVLNIPIEYIEG